MKAHRTLPSSVFGARGEPLVPSPSQHLKNLAAECRELAALTHDDNTRGELLLTAERFERLAVAREKGKAPAHPAPGH
jgi:hypothetical protein